MSREQIVRDTAYAIWEAEGKPEGRHAEHWRLAEQRVAASVGETAPAKASGQDKTAAATARKPKPAAPLKAGATKAAPKKPGPKKKG